jgi:hypothetical protein
MQSQAGGLGSRIWAPALAAICRVSRSIPTSTTRSVRSSSQSISSSAERAPLRRGLCTLDARVETAGVMEARRTLAHGLCCGTGQCDSNDCSS